MHMQQRPPAGDIVGLIAIRYRALHYASGAKNGFQALHLAGRNEFRVFSFNK